MAQTKPDRALNVVVGSKSAASILVLYGRQRGKNDGGQPGTEREKSSVRVGAKHRYVLSHVITEHFLCIISFCSQSVPEPSEGQLILLLQMRK